MKNKSTINISKFYKNLMIDRPLIYRWKYSFQNNWCDFSDIEFKDYCSFIQYNFKSNTYHILNCYKDYKRDVLSLCYDQQKRKLSINAFLNKFQNNTKNSLYLNVDNHLIDYQYINSLQIGYTYYFCSSKIKIGKYLGNNKILLLTSGKIETYQNNNDIEFFKVPEIPFKYIMKDCLKKVKNEIL